jgi:hypothetical protein
VNHYRKQLLKIASESGRAYCFDSNGLAATKIRRQTMTAEKTIKVSQKTYEHIDKHAQARGLSMERFLEYIIQEFDEARERAFKERLRAKGLIVSFPPTKMKVPRNFKPVPVKGKPVSEIIIEDREPK